MSMLEKDRVRTGRRWTVAVVHPEVVMERSLQHLIAAAQPEWQVLSGKQWIEQEVALDGLWSEAAWAAQCDFEGPQVWLAEDKSHSVTGLRMGIVDYLMTPLDADEVKASTERMLTRWQDARDVPTIVQLSKDQFERWQHIEYFEACGNYAWAHILGEPDPVLVSRNLKKLEEELPEDAWVRTHHSFLLNLYQVSFASFSVGLCRLKSGREVPMSERKKELVRTRVAPFLLKR